MTFTSLALKAVLIYAGSFVLLYMGALYGAEEAVKPPKPHRDDWRPRLKKEHAIAQRAGLQLAALPVIIWFIWTCVRAANLSPD